MDIIAQDPTAVILYMMACAPLAAFAIILILGLCRAAKLGDEQMEKAWRQYLKDHGLEE